MFFSSKCKCVESGMTYNWNSMFIIFRPLAVGATVATGLACILIIAASLTDEHAPQLPSNVT